MLDRWSTRHSVTAFLALIPLSFFAVPAGFASEERADGILSITRTYDALEVEAALLGGVLDGTPVHRLRLVRFRQGGMEPVPFDLMEMDEHGNYVLDGINKNVEWRQGTYELREEAVRAAGGMKRVLIELVDNRRNQPGILDGRDRIVFLARDAGDRHRGNVPGALRGMEMELVDPVDGARGWVYLLDAPELPLTPTQHLSYAFDPKAQTELVRSAGGAEVFFDLNKSAAYRGFTLPKDRGIDIAHTFRAEASFRLRPAWLAWLPRFSINPEDSTVPILVGYKDGVFVLRVVKNKIHHFLMERYLGDEIKDAELVTVSRYFPEYQYFRGVFTLSGKLKRWMRDLDVVMTTDFNENAEGMRFLNANNRELACLVDGRMSRQELVLNTDPYLWSMLTGSNGGWANILNMEHGNRELMRLFYDDDRKQGIYGSIGYRMTRVDEEDVISFETFIFLLPPNAGPEHMEQLVNLVYHPLEVRPGRTF